MDSQIPEEENSQRIGSYLLGRTVGAGTFGIVKAGIHLPTGEPVAIKIIVKSKISEVADVERVAREMHILRIVRHPSILQLYEVNRPAIRSSKLALTCFSSPNMLKMDNYSNLFFSKATYRNKKHVTSFNNLLLVSSI